MTLHLQTEDEGPASIQIGDHEIGPGSAPFIVAEAGVNHNGDVDRAKALADAALAAGADAVKFQVFKAAALVQSTAPAAPYQVAASGQQSQRELLSGLEMSHDHFGQLADHCRSIGIMFLATPFSVDDLRAIVEMGVPAIKLASPDLNNVVIVEAAAATGLPLLVSTGASRLVEIDEAVALLDQLEACSQTVLMHCVSAYPTAMRDAALSTIWTFRLRYDMWVGYSDHTAGVATAAPAVGCGAKVLEKHLTLDRAAPGPDHAFSLTPEMLAEYCTEARQAWDLLGDSRETVFRCEEPVRALARRSLVARVDIPAGQIIEAEHLILKRPGGGIPPREWSDLVGRRSACDIPSDTQLNWDMVS